jgi:hypothetical protein
VTVKVTGTEMGAIPELDGVIVNVALYVPAVLKDSGKI